MKRKAKIKKGDIVTYSPFSGNKQYGKVKSICDDPGFAFVVFSCNDDWDNYEQYTGQKTNIKNLTKGWK